MMNRMCEVKSQDPPPFFISFLSHVLSHTFSFCVKIIKTVYSNLLLLHLWKVIFWVNLTEKSNHNLVSHN